MRIMSSIRDTVHPDGSWRNKNGRPVGSGTKERLVLEYIAEHPEDSAMEIARALGISRTTVYKYINTPAHVRAEKIGQPVEDEYERMRRERLEKYMGKLGDLKT